MMKHEYWGYITRHDDGSWTKKQYKYRQHSKPIDPCKLPEEFKTKIAMLDFMNDDDRLPCGSHKAYCDGLKFLAYYLYIGVSSAREGEK